MKVFHVEQYGPNCWNFVPASLRVVRDPKARGCKCHGSGTLGTWREEKEGVEISHAIPCTCLHAIIDSSNEAAVEDELNQHFMDVKTTGLLCGCLFCQERRKVLSESLTLSV